MVMNTKERRGMVGWILSLVMLFTLRYGVAGEEGVAVSMEVSNPTPYQGEGVVVEINLSQVDHDKVMLFTLHPPQNQHYALYQVAFQKRERYHDIKHYYRYLIYPKVDGPLSLSFMLTQSITDDDKVAYAISGDRDNVKGLIKEDVEIALKPIELQVKALPQGTDLVGNYQLYYRLDKNRTKAYEPVNLEVEIQGEGEMEAFEFIPLSENYHRFSSPPKVERSHSTQGTQSRIHWSYAFSAKENFELPEVTLQAFDPKQKRHYTLHFPAQRINVDPVDQATLVDSKEYPQSSSTLWDEAWWGWLFSYGMAFLAGYMTPRGFWRRWLVRSARLEDPLEQEVRKAKTHRDLLKILLRANRKEDHRAVEALESVIYQANTLPLDQIKGMIKHASENRDT